MPSPFDDFFSWLSPDPEEAERNYKELRRKLIQYFTRWGCHIPDELADETFDRASKNIAEGKVDRSVNPKGYCFGVARNVYLEYIRRPQHDALDPDLPFVQPEPTWSERELACLEECLARLKDDDRDLLTSYYQYTGSEKIKKRKEMAEKDGGMNALRIRIHRIVNFLRHCVAACL